MIRTTLNKTTKSTYKVTLQHFFELNFIVTFYKLLMFFLRLKKRGIALFDGFGIFNQC